MPSASLTSNLVHDYFNEKQIKMKKAIILKLSDLHPAGFEFTKRSKIVLVMNITDPSIPGLDLIDSGENPPHSKKKLAATPATAESSLESFETVAYAIIKTDTKPIDQVTPQLHVSVRTEAPTMPLLEFNFSMALNQNLTLNQIEGVTAETAPVYAFEVESEQIVDDQDVIPFRLGNEDVQLDIGDSTSLPKAEIL